MTTAKSFIDVVVLAPLAEELDAFLQCVARTQITSENSLRYTDTFEISDVPFTLRLPGGRKIHGIAVCPNRMGRTETAVSVTRACLTYQPEMVLVVGRAGGLKYFGEKHNEPPNLGDVIVCTSLIDLDIRKMVTVGNDEIRHKMLSLKGKELRTANELASSQNWVNLLPKNVREMNPKVHFGTLISGNVVLSSALRQAEVMSLLGEYRLRFDRMPIGIEMEGIGAKIAVDSLGRFSDKFASTKMVMIRAVSDFADDAKRDDEIAGRHWSRYAAAAFSVSFISEFFLDKLLDLET